MRLSEFDYELPQELIAQQPLQERDQSRLMAINRTTRLITHHIFSDLPDLLQPTDLLVLNNTKVLPARLLGHRKGLTSDPGGSHKRVTAKIEVLLLRPIADDIWEVLVRPGRKMRPGEVACFGGGELECEVLQRGGRGLRRVRFCYTGNFEEIVNRLGHIPLPPYIRRTDLQSDKTRYQTVFATRPGAVAAPTAGLHFTSRVFDRLRQKGIQCCEVTLHVGLGTFQPVFSDTVEEHHMEKELFEISNEAAETIERYRSEGRRVIAIGTTVARTLESSGLRHRGRITAEQAETDLFVYPGFQFSCIDGLLTNFHLPRSTLLMLVSAFAGRDLVLQAYREAIRAQYRFYSYGDCMLIV